MLEFKNVCYSYDGRTEVLKDVTFSLSEGEKVALLGLNGSGKSTLILHTNGLLLPASGDVEVNGINTKSKSLGEVRKLVGIVFQNPDDQLFMPTVREDVSFGPCNMNLSEEEINERVEEALRITHTSELAEKSPFQLSGGQKKSVSIATVLSMTPEYLVMDEPISGLDYKSVEQFMAIVESLNQACLISTHDLEMARKLCSRAIVMKEGRVVYDGAIGKVDFPSVF